MDSKSFERQVWAIAQAELQAQAREDREARRIEAEAKIRRTHERQHWRTRRVVKEYGWKAFAR